MTRKDYQMIAKVLADMCCREGFHAGHVARALADAFEGDNPRFERASFLAAAGSIDYWYKENAEPKRKVS